MPDAPFWQKCNSHCVMCTNCDSYIEEPDVRYSLSKHREKIAEFKASGKDRGVYYRNGEHGDYFLFTGGEPTMNPEFFRLLGEYRTSFPLMPFTLLTNGRSFCMESFAKNTLRVGGSPFEVCVPVHGPDATTHDSVTRAPGSFDETVKGLDHLLKARAPGQKVEVRIILHKRPTEWLEDTLKYLLDRFRGRMFDRLTLVYFEVEGQAEKNFESIKIPLEDVSAKIDDCFPLLRRFEDARLYHFPLCSLSQRLWPYAWRTLPAYEIVHADACRDCTVNDICIGPHDWYEGRFGAELFQPFRRRPIMQLSGNPFHPVEAVGQGSTEAEVPPIVEQVKDEGAHW